MGGGHKEANRGEHLNLMHTNGVPGGKFLGRFQAFNSNHGTITRAISTIKSLIIVKKFSLADSAEIVVDSNSRFRTAVLSFRYLQLTRTIEQSWSSELATLKGREELQLCNQETGMPVQL